MNATKSPLTIFIVDDDELYLLALKKHLSKTSDHRVFTFSSGEECLENLSFCPDLILLDYYFYSQYKKRLNGLDILRQIKKQFSEIEVIMLSGQEDGFIVNKLAREGAYMYVIKDEFAFSNIDNLIFDMINEKAALT